VHARGQVAEKLQKAGLDVSRVALYDQKLLPLNDEARQAIENGASVLVPLFSPRTAGQFAEQCADPTRVHVIALSAAIADNLGELAVASLEIAGHPTSQEVCAILEKVILSDSLG
jgi:uroporphyrinogen-III synthase